MQNKFWDNIVSSKDSTEGVETPQNGVETDDGLSPSQWDDITSRIGEPDDASGGASDDLPDIPTPTDIEGSEALEQAAMSWQSKGVVTFPSGSTNFPTTLFFMNGLSGNAANKVWAWVNGQSTRYVYTVGAFSGGTATATRESDTTNSSGFDGQNDSGEVDGTRVWLFYRNPGNLELIPYNKSTGARLFPSNHSPSPHPSGVATVTTNNRVIALDSTSSPTTLRVYTFSPGSGSDFVSNTSNDITLASGAGTQALTNPQIISDGTYVWLVGINPSNAMQVLGYAYNLSTRGRVSSRDISYTDNVNLARVFMQSNGDVYIIRRRGSNASSVTNTARVLEYVTPTPTVAPCWATIPNLSAVVGSLFSLDLSDYVSGTPTPTIATASGRTLPTWLTLSGTTISGTPTEAACPVRVYFTATNSAGSTDVNFTIEVLSSTTALELYGVRITPLADRVTCSTEATPVYAVEFDDDVELAGGAGLETNVANWLRQAGIILPASQITVRARSARTIEALNAPCSTRRFARGVTYTLRIAIRPALNATPLTSAFSITGGTLTSVTEVGAGRLYDLLITFPSSGMGTTTLSALASAFAGISSNIQLLTCLYGLANLRTANFPTGIQPESTSVTFDIICEPDLTATPQASTISVSAGSVTSLCEIRGGSVYRCTIALPAGTGTSTVTALHGGFTNISANVVLGTISYRAV